MNLIDVNIAWMMMAGPLVWLALMVAGQFVFRAAKRAGGVYTNKIYLGLNPRSLSGLISLTFYLCLILTVIGGVFSLIFHIDVSWPFTFLMILGDILAAILVFLYVRILLIVGRMAKTDNPESKQLPLLAYELSLITALALQALTYWVFIGLAMSSFQIIG